MSAYTGIGQWTGSVSGCGRPSPCIASLATATQAHRDIKRKQRRHFRGIPAENIVTPIFISTTLRSWAMFDAYATQIAPAGAIRGALAPSPRWRRCQSEPGTLAPVSCLSVLALVVAGGASIRVIPPPCRRLSPPPAAGPASWCWQFTRRFIFILQAVVMALLSNSRLAKGPACRALRSTKAGRCVYPAWWVAPYSQPFFLPVRCRRLPRKASLAMTGAGTSRVQLGTTRRAGTRASRWRMGCLTRHGESRAPCRSGSASTKGRRSAIQPIRISRASSRSGRSRRAAWSGLTSRPGIKRACRSAGSGSVPPGCLRRPARRALR